MVFHIQNLPVEVQLQIYKHLQRSELDTASMVCRRMCRVIRRYSHRLAHYRLTLVVNGLSERFQVTNFEAGATQHVSWRGLRDALRNARIEFVLIRAQENIFNPYYGEIERQLRQFRWKWTGAVVCFHSLPLVRTAWERFMGLFANASKWYVHGAYVTVPVSDCCYLLALIRVRGFGRNCGPSKCFRPRPLTRVSGIAFEL